MVRELDSTYQFRPVVSLLLTEQSCCICRELDIGREFILSSKMTADKHAYQKNKRGKESIYGVPMAPIVREREKDWTAPAVPDV